MLETKNNIMLFEAKKARHKPNIILQVLIFFAVFFIANMASGIVTSIPLFAAMFNGTGSFKSSGADVTSISSAITEYMKAYRSGSRFSACLQRLLPQSAQLFTAPKLKGVLFHPWA